MEQIIKDKFIQVKVSTEVVDDHEDTFYTIDVYDGEPMALTEFEVRQLRDILNKLLDK